MSSTNGAMGHFFLKNREGMTIGVILELRIAMAGTQRLQAGKCSKTTVPRADRAGNYLFYL